MLCESPKCKNFKKCFLTRTTVIHLQSLNFKVLTSCTLLSQTAVWKAQSSTVILTITIKKNDSKHYHIL